MRSLGFYAIIDNRGATPTVYNYKKAFYSTKGRAERYRPKTYKDGIKINDDRFTVEEVYVE